MPKLTGEADRLERLTLAWFFVNQGWLELASIDFSVIDSRQVHGPGLQHLPVPIPTF